jgi:hypothetical protein
LRRELRTFPGLQPDTRSPCRAVDLRRTKRGSFDHQRRGRTTTPINAFFDTDGKQVPLSQADLPPINPAAYSSQRRKRSRYQSYRLGSASTRHASANPGSAARTLQRASTDRCHISCQRRRRRTGAVHRDARDTGLLQRRRAVSDPCRRLSPSADGQSQRLPNDTRGHNNRAI